VSALETRGPEWRGLTAVVYRSADGVDCTAGGITSRHARLTVVGWVDGDPRGTERAEPMPKGARVSAATDAAPAVLLVVRRWLDTVHLGPAVPSGDGYALEPGWHMAGGNYAVTSDSRMSDLISGLLGHHVYGALAVHDRRET
jgi:hypothetical protein